MSIRFFRGRKEQRKGYTSADFYSFTLTQLRALLKDIEQNPKDFNSSRDAREHLPKVCHVLRTFDLTSASRVLRSRGTGALKPLKVIWQGVPVDLYTVYDMLSYVMSTCNRLYEVRKDKGMEYGAEMGLSHNFLEGLLAGGAQMPAVSTVWWNTEDMSQEPTLSTDIQNEVQDISSDTSSDSSRRGITGGTLPHDEKNEIRARRAYWMKQRGLPIPRSALNSTNIEKIRQPGHCGESIPAGLLINQSHGLDHIVGMTFNSRQTRLTYEVALSKGEVPTAVRIAQDVNAVVGPCHQCKRLIEESKGNAGNFSPAYVRKMLRVPVIHRMAPSTKGDRTTQSATAPSMSTSISIAGSPPFVPRSVTSKPAQKGFKPQIFQPGMLASAMHLPSDQEYSDTLRQPDQAPSLDSNFGLIQSGTGIPYGNESDFLLTTEQYAEREAWKRAQGHRGHADHQGLYSENSEKYNPLPANMSMEYPVNDAATVSNSASYDQTTLPKMQTSLRKAPGMRTSHDEGAAHGTRNPRSSSVDRSSQERLSRDPSIGRHQHVYHDAEEPVTSRTRSGLFREHRPPEQTSAPKSRLTHRTKRTKEEEKKEKRKK